MRGERHVKDGDTDYFWHYDGRLRIGAAYHNVNNTWWFLSDKEAYNKASHELHFREEISELRGGIFEPATIEKRVRNSLKRAVEQGAYERAARSYSGPIYGETGGIAASAFLRVRP